MFKKSITSILTLVIAVGFLAVVWFNRYNINDYLVLRSYNPPTEISNIATEITLNDYGKRLFYVNKPEISDRSSFSTQCSETEQTIVLGCYTGKNIYVFKVDDPKLNGVEQVTAAHEMLHVAYSRLSTAERERVDGLISAAYKRINSPRITALADSYQKQEPGSVPNELHSILATEVADVGPELEAYYSRYFNNRTKVVEYATNYQKVFEDINLQVKSYDADLALRKSEIDRLESQLVVQGNELQSKKAALDSLLATGQSRQYNSQVAIYNGYVEAYNAEIAAVKILIEQYNQLVQSRNNLNIQQKDLAKSIDSRVDAINSR